MNSPLTYVCRQECGHDSEKIGLFEVIRSDDPTEASWLIARIPLSWGAARSSRLIPPDADGQIELPHSLFAKVRTLAEALKYFKPNLAPTRLQQ